MKPFERKGGQVHEWEETARRKESNHRGSHQCNTRSKKKKTGNGKIDTAGVPRLGDQ
jgi:hypothetical protein